MRKYVYIGLGGAAGAILRYLITGVHIQNYKEMIPLNTLFINVTGCFVLGFVLKASMELEFSPNVRLGIATGFLGAYTTFSSVCKQTVNLISGGYYFSAIDYVTVSVVLGFAATYFGVIAARRVAERKLRVLNRSSEENEAE